MANWQPQPETYPCACGCGQLVEWAGIGRKTRYVTDTHRKRHSRQTVR